MDHCKGELISFTPTKFNMTTGTFTKSSTESSTSDGCKSPLANSSSMHRTVDQPKPDASSAPAAGTTEPPQNLRPKEHGAYAIVAVPLFTAVLLGGYTLVGMCTGVAASAGFLAHEPLLVALGQRGARAQRAATGAGHLLAVLLAITGLGGAAALALGGTEVRMALILCFGLAGSSFMIAAIGRHRTFPAQLWGLVGLTAPCLPVLLSAGFSVVASLAIWSVWLIGFSSTTVAVRAVIAAQKRRPRTIHLVCLIALTVGTIMATRSFGWWLLISAPLVSAGWYLFICPPPATKLRRIGWTLVAMTMATAALIVAGHYAFDLWELDRFPI